MSAPRTYYTPSKETKSRQNEIFMKKYSLTIDQVKAIGIDYLKLFLNELSKKEYDLPYLKKNKSQIMKDFKKNKFFIYYDKKGHVSRYYGAERAIGINMHGVSACMFYRKFYEYKAFGKDKVIGDHPINNWVEAYFIICAHEFAHFVQKTACRHETRYRGLYQKSHGKAFQDMYRHIRREIVNPMLADAREEFIESLNQKAA